MSAWRCSAKASVQQRAQPPSCAADRIVMYYFTAEEFHLRKLENLRKFIEYIIIFVLIVRLLPSPVD